MAGLCTQAFLLVTAFSIINAQNGETEKLKRQVALLSRQVMMQQLFNEERIRSEGNSGIKAKRHRHEGTRPYYSDGYTGLSFMSIHDHANHVRTIGMGEFVAVLNGVEFRTRHNDYALWMPSTTSNNYHEVEKIEFPDVPPEVLAKKSLDEQIEEMRLYFKAFKEMDKSIRDYRKYFKPVLCYLEGAWTLTDPDKSIEEPFQSDRHTFSAIDWNELHEKIRFTAYTGTKDTGENLGFLPTSILGIVNETDPLYAQWNYRIMCHPLRHYLEVDRLRVVDDLGIRMAYTRTLNKHALSRSARFQLNPNNKNYFTEGHTYYTHLDSLMAQIPGKDNYRKWLNDDAFGMTAKDYNNKTKDLNAARYHRWYQLQKKGANGLLHTHRGFADDTVFMARNTRPEVAEQTVHDKCYRNKYGKKYCKKTYKQRWSYAIPLEIIYLTPLWKWNPYDIAYNGENNRQESGRNGGMTRGTAFKGTSSKLFFRTPQKFYSGKVQGSDAADTTAGRAVGVLNKKGEVCPVVASGVYIKLPLIEGVGEVRTRFPIAPVHQDGKSILKNLEALKDFFLLQESKFESLRAEFGLKTDPNSDASKMAGHNVMFSMQYARPKPGTSITGHTHTVTLNPDQMKALREGRTFGVDTSSASGHTHRLIVKYDQMRKSPYFFVLCDGKVECFDNHGKELTIVSN